MHLMYLLAIAAAEEAIDLCASYFVPDELTSKALVAARATATCGCGSWFRAATSIPPRSGSGRGRAGVRCSRRGVEIHEYEPTMLHAKLLVIDRGFVSVGSTNFDSRSFRLNDEASLNVHDAGFAREMTAVFEADLALAVRYTYEQWKQRPLKEKVSERLLWPIRSQL